MKGLTHDQLDDELDKLDFECCHPKKPLGQHQKVCILLGIMFKRFPFWVDMGGGKTRIALELLNYWKRKGIFTNALILAPTEAALLSWEKEIVKWQIDLPFVTLTNSPSALKWEIVNEFEEGGLILATYPGLVRMLSTLVKPPGKRKRKMKTNAKLMKLMTKKIQAMVQDEATAVMHRSSLTWRITRKLARTMKVVYQLAGRPMGKDPTTLWAQMHFIDDGYSLGETLGLFRAALFDEKNNYWGGTDYKFNKKNEAKLIEMSQHRSITYQSEECVDLPEYLNIPMEVNLPDEAMAYYKRFVNELKRRHAGLVEQQNAFLRMRQISSGFVGLTDDISGKKVQIEFATNPKLERMLELIEEIPKGRKFVIFHEFNYSGNMISQALDDMGIKYGWLHGGIKDTREIMDRFDDDPRYPGLLVNHKLGAFSLNLQRANYTFGFEVPVGFIAADQMWRRVRRQGQKRKVFEYPMVCRGTADAGILKWHKEGGDFFKAIIKDPSIL